MVLHLSQNTQLPDSITLDRVTRFSSTAIIFNDKDQVLMMMRDDCPAWILIGGLVDDGESFEGALHRETMEEANVEIDVVTFIGDYFSPISYEQPFLYKHDKTYMCHIKNDQTPCLGDEGIALKWFSIDEMPGNTPPRYIERIQGIKEKPNKPKILSEMSTRQFIKICAKDNMHMLNEWQNHPKVLDKKALNKLIFWP